MNRILLLLLFTVPLSLFAQDQLYGSWQGKMQSSMGNYVFTLDITPDYKDGNGYIKGVAVHNRNGLKEVIELRGICYADNSIYLYDDGNFVKQVEEGKGFSRLQFLFKYDGGELVLDGHWQEYEDLRKYRKGRLLLKKTKRKA